jgi:hypothetical protein
VSKDARAILRPFFPQTPAYQFLTDRLRQGVDERQALIDLVDSDVPLDREMRRMLAGDLREHYFPSSKRALKQRRALMGIDFYRSVKAGLKRAGWKATDADNEAAKAVGKSVEAINRQITRANEAKRKKRQRAK